MANSGKIFEENFRKSVESAIFYYRFRDSSGTWADSEFTRFTPSNIADNMLFYNGCLFLNELKSHQGKSIPISCIIGNKTKEKQIKDLTNANEYKDIFANIIVFFPEIERCFALNICDFNDFIKNSDRKSIPLSFFEDNAVEIETIKLRSNYRYNISKWLENY